MKTEQLNVRLESELIAELERAAREESLDRATMVRRILRASLTQRRIDIVLDRYQKEEISLGRACEDAGIDHYEMLDLIHARGITYPLPGSDLLDMADEILASLPHVADRARPSRPATAPAPTTLPDYAPRPDGILLVGINPAPKSVQAGHYYQGKLGQQMWKKLARVGLLDGATPGREDQAFVAAGHGLTDLVKRVTPSADDLGDDELALGEARLSELVRKWQPALVVFVFAKAAQAALVHRDIKPGKGKPFAGVPTFLLTGPYSAKADAERNLAELKQLVSFLTDRVVASSQRVTATDINVGCIRLTAEARQFFPAEKATLEVQLRGMRLKASYDPRTGPDRDRSAVLKLDRHSLARLVQADEILSVRPGLSGLVQLD